MDDVDRKILAELQKDGRQTLTELAERVRLSVSPCHRRLRALERSGAITGYHAALNAPALGLGFEALVFVTMRYEDRQTVAAFETAVAPRSRTSSRPSGCSATPTTCCASSPATWRRTGGSTTSASPPSPASSA
ncbi:DNA-binding Lrp family transcriptional regulator [Streptomyces ambofaciens]